MRLFLFTVCLLIMVVSEAGAQAVVVSSTSPSFKPGQLVDGTITIPDSGRVTLVNNDGKTTTLQGPYEGDAGLQSIQSDDGLVQSLSSVFSNSKNVTTLAVFRKPKRLDPWTIRTYKSGNICINTDVGTTLIRKRPLDETTMVIEPESGAPVPVNWTQGQSILDWPVQLEIVNRGSYTFRFDGATSVTRLTLIRVPKELSTDPHRANWMIHNGCKRQALLLLQEL